jgi:hypothetical protein
MENNVFIPRLTKKHLLFLAFSISSFFREFTSLYEFQDDKEDLVQKKYFDILQNVISDLLQGILYLLSKLKEKRESKKMNNSIKKESLDKDNIKENNKDFIKIIVKISAIDFFCQLLFLIFTICFHINIAIEKQNQNFLLIIDITSRFLFCRFILKTFFYRHHIASMIINMLVFIILGIIDMLSIINKKNEIEATPKIIFSIFLIIQTIAYSYEDVLNKIALEKDYFTPYSLLFYKGLFQIPLVIILSLFILIYNDDNGKNVWKSFFGLNTQTLNFYLIKRSIFIVFNILRSISLVQVIDKFSSQYLSILKVLESLFIYIYFVIDIQGNHYFKWYENIIMSISFLILVLTSLIYNEVLVLNIFGLQDYTQHGLDIQAEKDLRDAESEINCLNSDNCSSVTDSRSESFITQNVSFND